MLKRGKQWGLDPTTLLLAGLALGFMLIFFYPKIQHNQTWRATITPLASIIGSGFLIAAPLLYDLSGDDAVWVMLGLCVFAFAIGQVIRWNIQQVEPVLHEPCYRAVQRTEQCSDIALVFAYVLSVSYYLYLFSSFIVRAFGLTSGYPEKLITSVVLVFMAIFGFWRGFKALEKIEVYSVNIKLSIILVFLLALAWFNLKTPTPNWPEKTFNPQHIPMILGLLIMIQGFETSRYLGKEYSSKLRINSMRNAQLVSSAIYISFILLFTLVFRIYPLTTAITDTSVIDVAQFVFIAAPLFLMVAAVASQLSAALADFSGNGGLINEVSQQKIPIRSAYVIIALCCLVLVWQFDIFEIIDFASKGFALFYLFQCASCMCINFRVRPYRFYFAACVALGCLLVIVMGQPFAG